MQKIIVLLSVLVSLSFAEDLGTAQIVKLSQKGEKIAKVLCQHDKLPKAKGTIQEVMTHIAASGACKKLSKTKLKAVAYYVSNGSMKANADAMKVPEGAKCPVCGMFVSKYPKWAAMIDINGHKHYFDGVKDMMKYYIFDADFPYDRKKITQIEVTDFYTLEAIPARFAWFVYDSELFGPMGRELVPFSTEEAAKNFTKDHGGKKIVRFKEITPKMVMALDGVEYNE
jgi:nitrous oxide reductase accessory protein NosL